MNLTAMEFSFRSLLGSSDYSQVWGFDFITEASGSQALLPPDFLKGVGLD